MIAIVVSTLAICEGCKADGDQLGAVPNPTLQARAAQSAIASAAAQLEHDQHVSGMKADDSMRSPSPAATTGAPSGDSPVTNMAAPGDGASGPTARMLGEPLDARGANVAGGLPATLGIPHLYHLAADGFFLAQANAVGLTDEQQKKLTALKQHAAVAFAATQRRVRQGEKELWVLVCSEAPDNAKMELKVGEIARLGGQQRMDYIRTLEAAVAVLSDVQRKAVASQKVSAPMPPASAAETTGADPATSAGAMPPPPPVAGTPPDAGATPGMGHM